MRRLLFALLASASMIVTSAWSQSKPANTAPASAPKIELNAASVEPRQIEDTTEKAIMRDYGAAWQNLAQALEQNRADLINASFVGVAREQLTQAVQEQKSTGLHRRYVDRGHKLEAIFYSPEGSAMQLRDTAQLELELLDGDKVVHREQLTAHYLTLLTPTENSWKIRVLQQVP
jgi:hypothetical protein